MSTSNSQGYSNSRLKTAIRRMIKYQEREDEGGGREQPAGSIFFLLLILAVIVCSLSFFSWFLILLLITQFLLLVLPHFLELQERGNDKETPDTGVQDTGFHCRARKFLRG